MSLHDADFVAVFSDLMQRGGRWRNHEPADLVARWVNLVERCVRGFPDEAEDYFDELTSRDDLERAMGAPELSGFPQMLEVRKAVQVADGRFQEILRSDAFPKFSHNQWWNRGVVRYAGPRLVDELNQHYGVKIDLVAHDGT